MGMDRHFHFKCLADTVILQIGGYRIQSGGLCRTVWDCDGRWVHGDCGGGMGVCLGGIGGGPGAVSCASVFGVIPDLTASFSL